MVAPMEGVTVEAHVLRSLVDAQMTITRVLDRVSTGRRLRPAERQTLWRELAGVVGACETVRLWLSAGAPR